MLVTEYVFVERSKSEIEKDLLAFGSRVEVVGSRIQEDGYDLIIEGDANQVADLIVRWQSDEGK